MDLRLRALLAAVLAGPLLLAGPSAAADATTIRHPAPPLQVDGAVAAPVAYGLSDLAAMPQTTLPDHRGGREHVLTGVLLQSLVDRAQPQLPTGAKNANLRVTATVSGPRQPSVTTAWGEFDSGFGNHPALLVLARDGRPVHDAPALVFPGDTDRVRTVRHVDRIAVAVAPTAAGAVDPGSVAVVAGGRIVVLSAARLAALPQRTEVVSFLAGTATQTRTETGPTLAAVLRAARVRTTLATSAAASATDGYVAVVTPGEALSGRRILLLSLVEDGKPLARPRLVPAGDVRGGRYVSEVTTLTVTMPGVTACPFLGP